MQNLKRPHTAAEDKELCNISRQKDFVFLEAHILEWCEYSSMIWMRIFYNDHHERKQRTLILDLTACRPVVHCQLHGTNWRCGISALYCTMSMHRDSQIVSVYVFMRERKKTRFIVLVSERLLFCPRSGIGVYVVNYQGYPIILNNKWNLTHNNWWPPSLLLLLLCVFVNPGRVNNEASLF